MSSSQEEALLKSLIKGEVERLVPPEMTVLLDDIARGVRAVQKRLEAQVPEGFKEEVDVSVEGTIPVPMEPKLRKPPFIRATVFNDGPDPVYVFLNEVKPEAFRKAPLNAQDKLDIDTTEAKIDALFFACEASEKTASVRVHLLK